jgi:hypothetical protein
MPNVIMPNVIMLNVVMLSILIVQDFKKPKTVELFLFSADCFDEGFDYQSGLLLTIPGLPSPNYCLSACKTTLGCLFYSFNLETQGPYSHFIFLVAYELGQ